MSPADIEESQYQRATSSVGAATSIRVAATAVTATAGLVTTVLAVRLLGPVQYGTLAFALSLVGLATGISRLGLGPATLRTVAAHADESEALTRTIRGTITVLTGTALIAAAAIAAVLSMDHRIAPEVSWVAMALALGAFLLGRNLATANFWTAAGMGRVSAMELGNLSISVVQVSALGALTLLGRRDLTLAVTAYGLAGLVGSVVSVLSLRRLTRRLTSALRLSTLAGWNMLRVAAPYAISGAAIQIIGQFDVFVLGLTGSRAEVGLYEPTLRLSERLLNLVPFLFMAGFVPAATRLLGGGRRDEFELLYRTVSMVVYVLATPAVILLAAFPGLTLEALFGQDFSPERGVAWILLVGYGTNLVFGLNGGALHAAGNRRALVLSYGSALLVMALTAVTIIPPLGSVGAAIATTTSYIVLNLAVALALYRVTGVHIFALRPFAVITSSMAPIVLALLLRDGPTSFAVAVLVVLTLWVGWVGSLFMLKVLRWADVSALIPRRPSGTR